MVACHPCKHHYPTWHDIYIYICLWFSILSCLYLVAWLTHHCPNKETSTWDCRGLVLAHKEWAKRVCTKDGSTVPLWWMSNACKEWKIIPMHDYVAKNICCSHPLFQKYFQYYIHIYDICGIGWTVLWMLGLNCQDNLMLVLHDMAWHGM